MSVELVNSHVLFPIRANYAEPPSWERRWENDVVGAEFGNESRYGHRATPRVTLQWQVTARDLQEDAQLIDRIMAAKKSGLACAPYFGRGIELSGPAFGTTIQIEPTLFQFQVFPSTTPSFVILIDDDGNYDVAHVNAVLPDALIVDASLSRTYHAGNFIWPLIFGRFACEGLNALRSEIGEAKLAISELTAPATAVVGVADPPIDGIGGWIIEDTFIVQ